MVFEYKLSLQELWNVDDDGHDDWGQDVGEEVHLGGVAQLVGSVEKRLADSKESLSCDAHGQECFPAEENILHWVQEIWEECRIDLFLEISRIIHKNEDKKYNITTGQCNKTLMKC